MDDRRALSVYLSSYKGSSISAFEIGDGYDYADTSFHILTIDGVRGRDTLGRE